MLVLAYLYSGIEDMFNKLQPEISHQSIFTLDELIGIVMRQNNNVMIESYGNLYRIRIINANKSIIYDPRRRRIIEEYDEPNILISDPV